MILAEARRLVRARLAQRDNDSEALEADLLLGAVTGLDRGALIARSEQPLTDTQQHQLEGLISRRIAGEPIAHLLGAREFWSLSLRVNPAVLIPRPETETLVEHALAALPEDFALRVADLGTGSGAIAAALAHERPRWTLFAVDAAAGALAVAADNCSRLGLPNLVLVQCDWTSTLACNALDAIVSNPPYVREDDAHLSQGDLRFEPRSALTAGTDGLAAIRTIVADAPRCLRPGGLLALEHGWDQAHAVRDLLRARGFDAVRTFHDLAGHERVTSARLPRIGPGA